MMTVEVPNGWELRQTCAACPEQYDLLDAQGARIGFFHLRWGYFSVRHPGPGEQIVYEKTWHDPASMMGTFPDDTERDRELSAGVAAVRKAIEAKTPSITIIVAPVDPKNVQWLLDIADNIASTIDDGVSPFDVDVIEGTFADPLGGDNIHGLGRR